MGVVSADQDYVIASVSSTGMDFTQYVARAAGQHIDSDEILLTHPFTVGERCPKFHKDIKDKRVYLVAVQSPHHDPQELAMRTYLSAAAAWDNGAKDVVLVSTELPYSRQDRGPNEDSRFKGQPNSARWYAKLLYKTANISKVLTWDVHSDNVKRIHEEEGGKLYNINPAPFMAHYLRTWSYIADDLNSNGGDELVIVRVDEGSEGRCVDLQTSLYLPNVSILRVDKIRHAPNDRDKLQMVLSKNQAENFQGLENKIALFPDDGIETGGTLFNAHKCIMDDSLTGLGTASGDIAMASHGWLTGKSYRNVQNEMQKRGFNEVVFTNSRYGIENDPDYRFKKIFSWLKINDIFGYCIKEGLEKDKHPDELFSHDSFEDIRDFIETPGGMLYKVREHSRHFLRDIRERKRSEIRQRRYEPV